MARTRFKPTDHQRQQVLDLYGFGLPADQVRQHIINPQTNKPISKTLLFKYFRNELDGGQAIANAKVVQTAFQIATDTKNPRCAAMNMFWQKTRMGFREVERANDEAEETKSVTVEIKTAEVKSADTNTQAG